MSSGGKLLPTLSAVRRCRTALFRIRKAKRVVSRHGDRGNCCGYGGGWDRPLAKCSACAAAMPMVDYYPAGAGLCEGDLKKMEVVLTGGRKEPILRRIIRRD